MALRKYDRVAIVAAIRSCGNQAEVARRFGCSIALVSYCAKQEGLLGTRGRKAQVFDVPTMTAQYLKGLSCITVGRLHNCCPQTVMNKLHAAGVSLRPRTGWPYVKA